MRERCSSIRYRLQTRRDGRAEAYATDDAEGTAVDPDILFAGTRLAEV
jgi:hypothetical protein